VRYDARIGAVTTLGLSADTDDTQDTNCQPHEAATPRVAFLTSTTDTVRVPLEAGASQFHAWPF
jgi:hypothetical protein